MKSSDSIPSDEMLLAEACAAAKARGLDWIEGALFLDENGWGTGPQDAVSCCALGALVVAERITMAAARNAENFAYGRFGFAPSGNDDTHWMEGEGADKGESLGWAFRCFMTQDESDPETERLIRERSGK